MTTTYLKRHLVSESTGLRIAQGLASFASLVIMVVGVFKLSDLELTESQLLLGVGALFTMALQCATIVMLLDLKGKRVSTDPPAGRAPGRTG